MGGKTDMVHLVNLFHLALVGLECTWYGEWVPSKMNIADIMTRPERFHELEQYICGDDVFEGGVTFPPVHAEWEQLVAKAREFRALPKL